MREKKGNFKTSTLSFVSVTIIIQEPFFWLNVGAHGLELTEAVDALQVSLQSITPELQAERLSHLLLWGAENFSSLGFGYSFSLTGKIFYLCVAQERIQNQ